ncbi:hypothetical protein MPL3356_340200 [Mesorhizobium plurifarium]|uniref:Hydantoinase/oxoprolinase N-terminal domain-containing protein n=1 Tax=Mesorhizobium plurifarium TaxID=69974 RepID=A0A090FQA9_MESPL|nr:hypothetical protein MPL3356_340200 [Mesorhizobium plurifarium]
MTTRHDLAVGISGAVDAVLDEAATDPAGIKLVSMSTTLATNGFGRGSGRPHRTGDDRFSSP